MKWQATHLSDLLIDAQSGFASGEDPPDGVFQFRMNNITTEGALDLSKKRRVPRTTRNINAFLVESGDVLFNSTNSPELVGKTAFFPGYEEPAVFSNHFIRLRPCAEKLDGRFLSRWLQLQFQRRVFQHMCHQWVNQATVGRDLLLALKIPLPPLSEQQRIAEVLDRTEALRAKRRAALAQLDTLIQAIFLDIFGDPISNPRQWTQENLETFFQFRTGKLDSNAAVASGQFPFFTCSREDLWIDNYAFDCEALLLAGNNASADYSVKHYIGKFNAYQRTYVITLRDNRNSYKYARFVLEHRLTELKRISKGTNTKYLTLELLNKIHIPVPPHDLQREFARRVAAIEKLKTAHRTSLAEMEALFASLQHRAFRGEL